VWTFWLRVNHIQPSHDTYLIHSTAQGADWDKLKIHHPTVRCSSPRAVAQADCQHYIDKHMLTCQTLKLTKLYLSIEAPNIAQRPFLTTADLLG
jgi:hypothetical protein